MLFGLSTSTTRTSESNGLHLHFELAGAGEDAAAVLVPRFTADSPAAKWEVGRVMMRDVSGNEVTREPVGQRVGETCCWFMPALWPTGGWEVTIFAKRQVPLGQPVPEPFPPEELLVFKDVEINGSGSVTLNQELERRGTRLRLTQFTLRPPKDLNEPWQPAEASELHATLSQSPNGTAHVDLAEVTDDHGKTHYPRARGYSTTGRSGNLDLNYNFPTLPLDARKLAITFVVQRGREFTFRVKPEIATSPVNLR